MGELEVRLTLAQHIGPKAAELAAKGWGGDRYVLLQQGQTGPYVLVMRTGWDDQSEADEFWSFYQVLMGHRTGYTEQVKDLVGPVPAHWWSSKDNWVYAHRQDRYVDIVIGPDQDSVAQVVEALSR
jgi:hypothetical protein